MRRHHLQREIRAHWTSYNSRVRPQPVWMVLLFLGKRRREGVSKVLVIRAN
jgi:hypothetical protein